MSIPDTQKANTMDTCMLCGQREIRTERGRGKGRGGGGGGGGGGLKYQMGPGIVLSNIGSC